MAGLVDTLSGILHLEQKRGFSNSAVIGGLERFSAFLDVEENVQQIHQLDLRQLRAFLRTYASLSTDHRQNSILGILSWLKNHPEDNRLALDTEILQNISLQPVAPFHSFDKALLGPIQSIRGIGEKNVRLFNKLGIQTVYDLLRFFPRRYQDFSQLKTISQLEYGDELSLIGTLTNDLFTRASKKGNLKIIEGTLGDGSGTIKLTWFNQPYLTNQLRKGSAIVVSGKVDMYLGRLVMNSPDWETLDSQQLHTNRIVPMYPLTAGLGQRQVRKILYQNLPFWSSRVREYFPPEILEEGEFPEISGALKQIHFPDSSDSLNQARSRFAFEELIFLQLGVMVQKNAWSDIQAQKYPLPEERVVQSERCLPFQLTASQGAAIRDILADLNSGKPMNRLLQGDVGSGKTVVAKFAMHAIIQAGAQVAVMAPTSILAEQHFHTFIKFLTEDNLAEVHEIALLIGSTPARQKEAILKGLVEGHIKVIIGTHALIEWPVEFQRLQLAVIDEQHRFGVEQRSILREKGENPHILVMTATPIPRSLALTVYGDLDVTTLSEMPVGRQPVETRIIDPAQRQKAYQLIREQIDAGFQAFIVYPLIETDEEEDFRAATSEYERLQKDVFPDIKAGLMHGKLKPAEKDKIMQTFRNKEFSILVSTTVIEVGVDIPAATVVLVESANRFGLAQLHQIRGRVGRNSDKSYCLLIPESASALENERLGVMAATNDGFRLAEFDLTQRGPGEFLGTRQSGYAGLRFSSITDIHLIEKCRKHAHAILAKDPHLEKAENQLLKEQLQYFWPGIQFNLNN